MRLQFLLAVLFHLTLGQPPASAVDLTKVERTIAKEPAYQGKPKYCLLVFGLDAKHRVWLVQDGPVLYIDRNGTGDLTEPGNKIAAEKWDDADEDGYTFKLRDLRIGARVHRDLYVQVGKLDFLATRSDTAKTMLVKNPQASSYFVALDVDVPGWNGTGVDGRVRQTCWYMDANGVFQFADRPGAAPIVHFAGPLDIALFGRHRLKVGREGEIVLGVGSPGLGAGTHTWIDYEGVIPEKAYPTLEIAYPPRQAGQPPIREKLELKQRC
jgi:hypothetical protein